MRSKTLIITVIVLVVVAALAVGIYIGKKQGATQTESNLQPLVNLAFPKPPDVQNYLIGTVTGIYGGTIDIQVKDPNDYLPHTDGTPQKTQIRYASINNDTKIFTTDYTQRDSKGNPLQVALKLSDIKVGNMVKVTSLANIRDAQKFDATQVAVIR